MPVLKVRKLPKEVEAILYTGENLQEIIDWVGNDETVKPGPSWSADPSVLTTNGRVVFCEGEYIIKGVDGEFYPCPNDVFKQTYEEVK